jgi:acyl dehydratase
VTAAQGSRYLEDFAPGQRFGSVGQFRFDIARAKAFAAEFDPQGFHLDERAAQESLFSGLVVSGWHTAAATMRLLVDSELKPAGGILGAGIDELRWLRPVRPNDEIRVESEVLEVTAPQPGRQHGTLRVRTITLNQRDEPVMSYVATLRVPVRPHRT